MHDWRGAGFVADSDDDSELSSIEPTKPDLQEPTNTNVTDNGNATNGVQALVSLTQNPNQPPATELVDKDTDAIVPSSSTAQDKDVFNISDSSSDLSSPPSSLEEPQLSFEKPSSSSLQETAALEQLSRPESLQQSLAIHETEPDDLPPDVAQGLDEYNARTTASRTFRKRNAIQLHPYLLENEQYRKSLQARGLRPVLVGEAARKNHATNEHSSQYTESQEDSYRDSGFRDDFQNLFSSSEDEEISQVPFRLPDPQDIATANSPPSDDDFAQYEEARGRAKRRRIDSSSQEGDGVGNVSNNGRSGERQPRSERSLSSEDRRRDRISRQEKRRIMRAKFRVPRGMTPPPLPTPDPSSEVAAILPKPVDIDDDADEALLQTPIDLESHADILATGDEPRTQNSSVNRTARTVESVDETVHLKQIRRRMKGVLPASWVHLDRQTQLKLPSKPREHEAPPGTPDGTLLKGVARRTVKSLSHRTPDTYHLSVQDDSESSPERSPLVKVSGNSTWRGPTNVIELDDDIPEEDEIDDMIPKSHRSVSRRSVPKGRRKRTAAVPSNLERSSNTTQTEPRRSRPSTHTNSERRGKSANRMSIYDATANDSRDTMPRFVRIARRTCSSRPNKGRHSPTNKVFSLHSRDEGIYMHNTLIDWRSGRLSNKGQQSTSRNDRSEQSLHHTTRKQQMRLDYFHQPSGKDAQEHFNPSPSTHQAKPSRAAGSDQQFYRPGQLENIEEPSNSASFSGLRHLRNILNQADPGVFDDTRLDFEAGTENNLSRIPNAVDKRNGFQLKTPSHARRQQAKSRHKKPPRRRIPDNVEIYELPRNELNTVAEYQDYTNQPRQDSNFKLKGFGLDGTDYSTDFGIKSFQSGICLHPNTFLGSGELATSLGIESRDVEKETTPITLHCGTLATKLSSWDEEVADRLEFVVDLLVESTSSCSNSNLNRNGPNDVSTDEIPRVLRQLMLYIAKHLWFRNAEDKVSFASRFAALVEKLVEAIPRLSERVEDPLLFADRLSSFSLGSRYLLVIVTQLILLHRHDPECQGLIERLSKMQRNLAASMMDTNVGKELAALGEFHSAANLRLVLEAGITKNHPCSNAIETIVCVYNCLEENNFEDGAFWQILDEVLCNRTLRDLFDLRCLENTWFSLFSILPFLAFDKHGLLQQTNNGRSVVASSNCWTVVKKLCSSVMEQYSQTDHASILNNYVKTLTRRCYTLIVNWRWHSCEPSLSYLFDFFANRNLSQLRHESGNGPSKFLENFCPARQIPLEQGDTSFQLFLKCLAVGLLRMQSIKSEKKMKNIVWRFVPNHGRQHRKEEQLSQQDLDALRNHHELLCVLHMASSAAVRPKVSIVRQLVDFTASHVEASRVSIRALCNLTRFQLATAEPLDRFIPFSEWLNTIIRDCSTLYASAQVEAENFGKTLERNRSNASKQWLDQVVRANRRQVLVLLETAMNCLAESLTQAVNCVIMQDFFGKCNLSELFGFLDPRLKHSKPLALCLLAVYKQYIAQIQKLRNQKTSQLASDESQDYGEWPEDDIVDGTDQSSHLNDNAIKPLHQLLSNWFGDENFQNNDLLASLVKVWVAAASLQVEQKIHDWSYFLDEHGLKSWSQLRETDTKRRFLPYFIAEVILVAPESLVSNEKAILSAWVASLVAPNDLQQYQNRLTNVLLDQWPSHPLLSGLPRMGTSVNFPSTADFQPLRLQLIDGLLSNMRSHVEHIFVISSVDFEPTRRELVELLKLMMTKMKSNFVGLDPSSTKYKSYTGFIQTVVQYLQQYATEICPVDRFFIDDAAFPLPIHDPLYVSGRLQSHAFRITDSSVQKKLATFIQNVVERAVIENKQHDLVDQFIKSLHGDKDRRSCQTTEMRYVVLGSIFPVYIAAVKEHACGWLFAQPILNIANSILPGLFVGINLLDTTQLDAIAAVLGALLDPVTKSLPSVLGSNASFQDRGSISIAGSMFQFLTATAPIIDFLQRLQREGSLMPLSRLLQSLYGYSRRVIEQLNGSSAVVALGKISESAERMDSTYTRSKEIDPFASRSLYDALRFWVKRDTTSYYVKRGTTEREVHVQFETLETEQQSLRHRVAQFRETLLQMPSLRSIVVSEDQDPLVLPNSGQSVSAVGKCMGIFV